DNITPENYLRDNLNVFKAVIHDPYVVGCDFVGEEINDIYELKPVIQEIVALCNEYPFTIRIHAGENDSLIDNVENSIKCIKESLKEGQSFPDLRLGHGIHTPDLNTRKGQRLLKLLKENEVILEFQLTSNVRLNNLTNTNIHPLKQYLDYGINCVQGTDGAAAYGTSSMDEQIAIERLLKLSREDQLKMKATELKVIERSLERFKRDEDAYQKFLNGHSLIDAFNIHIQKNIKEAKKLHIELTNKYDANEVLKEQIKDLPNDKMPIIIAGGSFNTVNRKTVTNKEEKDLINRLLKELNPDKCFFVIGNKIDGYEKYLLNRNKNFEVYSIVPALISEEEIELLKNNKLNIRVSTESLGMGIYKSFNYEIFERRNSILIALDGNSAVTNLVQEAKNGKGKAKIYVSDKSEVLRNKLDSLKGYIKKIDANMIDEIKEISN
ncbi:MAG: amidohydrolase family protein, partial [Erysipelotrichaceae bacterium]|nr:amidohydrolase family protein [Erysipelotrichaceae bacterium]